MAGLIGLVAWTALGACARVYEPVIANMAMPANRGDLEVTGGSGNSTGVAVSYAVTDHLAGRFQADMAAGARSDASQYRADVGVGWFWSPGQTADDRARPGWRAGASIDVGPGHVFDSVSREEAAQATDFLANVPGPNVLAYRLSAFTLNTTAQGQVGYKTRWLSFAVATRIVEEHLFFDAENYHIRISPPDYLYLEPVLDLRTGWAPFYVDTQLGVSAVLAQGTSGKGVYQDHTIAILALGLDFDRVGVGHHVLDWDPHHW